MTSDSGSFRRADLRQLESRGISEAEARRQLALLREPPSPPAVLRSCTVGEGIERLDDDSHELLEERWREVADAGKLLKFVPASGAATRMFRDIRRCLAADDRPSASPAEDRGDVDTPRRFLEALPDLPFFDRLASTLADQAEDVGTLIRERDFPRLARALVDADGLGYDLLPKALIEFHRYPREVRTPLEEHLVEAAGYLASRDRSCRLHFTVSPEHLQTIAASAEAAAARLESRIGVTFRLELSVQGLETDTLALAADGHPARQRDGALLLRPSGHGALLPNLERSGADIAVVKNIDNIAPQRLHRESARWKRLLIGRLVELQAEVARIQDCLERHPDADSVAEGLALLSRSFAWEPPPGLAAESPAVQRRYLLQRLDRPIRVCGVVPNRGEPGGGPFWVADEDGAETGQILETAQLDAGRPELRRLLAAATHFNPVDLVCGLKDRKGRSYDLERFTDPRAVIVADKTHEGRPIRALERPGLWNGAMAEWNTCFVEVPLSTFTPVKTLFDLLRPEHRA